MSTDVDRETQLGFVPVGHLVGDKVGNNTVMVVTDLFDATMTPTMTADPMEELGHRLAGVDVTHQGGAQAPLPHKHILRATCELVHAAS